MVAKQWKGKSFLISGVLVWAFLFPEMPGALAGEALFKAHCVSCHSVGGGRLVGPDLKGLYDRRDAEWIFKFIKSPEKVIKSGDAYAVAMVEKYGKMVMPTLPLSDQEVDKLMAYIKTAGSGEGQGAGVGSVEEAPEEVPQATEAQIAAGRDMFQGNIRFKNKGASCISCHHVKNDAVIGGGILAKELTSVFSSMGGAGVSAILGKPPFAVMNAAYEDKPLTQTEIFSLVAFLQYADSNQAYQQPRDYGIGLFISGVVGAIVLLLLYQVLWWNRKKNSVNQEIFDRQVKSTTDW